MLKIFETEDLSAFTSVTQQSLPPALHIGNVDADKLILERDEFLKNYTISYDNTQKWENHMTNEVIEELRNLGWVGSNYWYDQKQICKIKDNRNEPFNEFNDGVGEYTKEVLNLYSPFNRPRYIFSGKGWSIKKHADWSINDVAKHGFRMHIMLKTDDQNFCVIDENGTDVKYNFKKGEVWFLNVTYEHSISSVVNTRESISFDMLSDKLIRPI